MPGLMAAAMKTQAALANASLFTIMEIDWPAGTKRYCMQGGSVNSDSKGTYDPRVKSFGKTKIQLPRKDKSLQSYRKTVVLSDTDFDFMNRVGQGQRLEGSACRVYWGSALVPSSSWYQSFGGVLKGWAFRKPMELELTFGAPEKRLKQRFTYNLLNVFDFPNADKTALGKTHPILYGVIDDSGYFDSGAVLCEYIDTVAFRYLVSVGWVTVLRVYKANAILATSGWSVQHVTIGGIPMTLIKLTATATTSQISADVIGFETVGNGTGTTLLSAVDQIQHLLVNFVFNRYPTQQAGGLWISGLGGAPINSTKFTACKTALSGRCNGSPYGGGRVIDTVNRTGEQELNDWCASNHVDAYWDNLGQLCIAVDDPCQAPSAGADVVRYPADQLSPLGFEAMDADLCYGAIAQFKQFNGNANAAMPHGQKRGVRIDPPLYDQLEVDDPLSSSAMIDQVQATWHPMSTP